MLQARREALRTAKALVHQAVSIFGKSQADVDDQIEDHVLRPPPENAGLLLGAVSDGTSV